MTRPDADLCASELVADYMERRDEAVLQALLAAGVFVASADGRLEPVEREELVGFIDRLGLAPASDVAEAFESRLRERDGGVDRVMQALRPVAGLSLTSVVLRGCERVAAADRRLHPSELEALDMIRRMLASLGGAPRHRQDRMRVRRAGT